MFTSTIMTITKLFGIGMVTLVMEELLKSQGHNNYANYIKIASAVIGMGIIVSELSGLLNSVISTFNLM